MSTVSRNRYVPVPQAVITSTNVVLHTPQNSRMTIDSGKFHHSHHGNGRVIMDELDDDDVDASDASSVPPSPPSPLSEAMISLRQQQQQNQDIMSSYNDCNDYKRILQILNNFLSPIQLFDAIDALIGSYQELKNEYCSQWKLQQLYRQQIRSCLKHSSSNAATADSAYGPSLDEVQLLIQRLQNIQSSVGELFQNLFQQSPPDAEFEQDSNTQIKSAHCKKRSTLPVSMHMQRLSAAPLLSKAGSASICTLIKKPISISPRPRHYSETLSHSRSVNISRKSTSALMHGSSGSSLSTCIESGQNIRPSHAKKLTVHGPLALTAASMPRPVSANPFDDDRHMMLHDRDSSHTIATHVHRHRNKKHKKHKHKKTKHRHKHQQQQHQQQQQHRDEDTVHGREFNAYMANVPRSILSESQIDDSNMNAYFGRDRPRGAHDPTSAMGVLPPPSSSINACHSHREMREYAGEGGGVNYNTMMQQRRRRSSSIRSFGSLYSNEFRHEVASHYRLSVNCMSSQTQFDINAPDALGLNIARFYHNDYIGQNQMFVSPFGERPVLYCDWTASGKALQCVEQYLMEQVMPLYANTHTLSSITGQQTSKFRSEARSIILESMQGEAEQDVVLFCGAGATAAIDKMAHVLMKSTDRSFRPETTVVFISIYEHDSNIYIWKELGCKVLVIAEDKKKGALDLKMLKRYLQFYTSTQMKHKYKLLIGSFAAASNVSGICAPIDEATLLLHNYGALAFWDFATAAPYTAINMTNQQNALLSKDAVFISTHKFLGGPSAPGILCAKKRLFQNYTPVTPGCGTLFVAYGIEDGEWEYLENIEEREEGGTPDIVGSIRASVAFMAKDHIGIDFIQRRERRFLQYFWSQCKPIENLVIMGNTDCDRLPIISFLITHTKREFGASLKTKYLHYNLIAALMNDLFGIQGRGGCACAGMYGKHVLGISDQEVQHVISEMRDKQNELARPGYFRINLHYTLTDEELHYIINAVQYICNKGWLFLPLYDVDPETGAYFYRDKKPKPLRSLLDLSFDKQNGEILWNKKRSTVPAQTSHVSYSTFFKRADEIIENIHRYLPAENEFANEQKINDIAAWYWLPSELHTDVTNYAL